MNIINKSLLKLALLPSSLYEKMGADTAQLRSIVTVKLIMDDRRPNTFQQTRKSDKQISMSTLGTMFISLLLGLLYLLSFGAGQDMVTKLTIYFSLFFLMLSATLISDFTSVLIDVRDNYIILPKPVSDRTFVVARLLHIFIHLCKIIIPMALPGLIALYVMENIWGSIIFLISVVFVSSFSIFFINAVYILILKITTPQRFQSIISYVQIVFAILMYGSYQVFPRLLGEFEMEDFDISSFRYIIFYPLYWLACTWKMFFSFTGTGTEVFAGIAGFLLPFISLFIMIRYLAPSFNNKLALINQSGTPTPAAHEKISRRISYPERLSRIITRGNAERMGFLFTWKMSSRSRDFKIKVYPSIGYIIVYGFIVFWNSHTMNVNTIAEQGWQGKLLVISALYISSMLLTMAISQSFYSDKYKAAWIFHVSPLQKPGDVILGSTKASIFKFYIPIVLFITLTGVIIIGPIILPNILLGLFNELLIATLLVYMGNRYFPFTVHQNADQRTGSFMRNLMILMISFAVATGHFFIYNSIPAVLLCCLLSIAATWLIMSSIRNTPWSQIKSYYKED